jgi:ribonuclease P protein component
MNRHQNTFKKEERLTGIKAIAELFEKGKTGLVYPLKFVFIEKEANPDFSVHAAFSISKKNFKKAVERNLIKRRMKEAYRLNKKFFYEKLKEKNIDIIFIYIANEILPYPAIEKSIKEILNRLIK